jgi:TnpA family transposase
MRRVSLYPVRHQRRDERRNQRLERLRLLQQRVVLLCRALLPEKRDVLLQRRMLHLNRREQRRMLLAEVDLLLMIK